MRHPASGWAQRGNSWDWPARSGPTTTPRRIDNTLYLDAGAVRDGAHGSEVAADILDVVRSSIQRSTAQTMALEHEPGAEADNGADFEIDL